MVLIMKITKLTQEQIDLQHIASNVWIDKLGNIALDKEKVEKGLDFLYSSIGKNKPDLIVYVDSPLAMQYAYFILSKFSVWESVRDSVCTSVRNSVQDSVWDSVRESVCDSVRKSVRNSVQDSVWESVRESVCDSVCDSVEESVRNSVQDSVWDSVRDSVLDSVWDSVEESVEESVQDSVWDSVRNSVCDSVRNSVCDSVRDSVEESVRESVCDSVCDSVRDSVEESVCDSVLESVWKSVRESVRNSVWDSVEDSVEDSVRDSVRKSVQESVRDSVEGLEYQSMGSRGSVIDWHWIAFYDYFQRIGIELTPQFNIFKDFCCDSGAFDYLLYENLAIVCGHPSNVNWKTINNQRILHNDLAPALEWSDSFKLYALNGTAVPEYLVMTPSDDLDLKWFLEQTNADVKIEFINKYGIDRMLSLGTVIDDYHSYDDEWYNKSEYQLIDMSAIFESKSYAPFLKMKHQTMDMYCMEGVSDNCKTITDALGFRAEVSMNEYQIISIK